MFGERGEVERGGGGIGGVMVMEEVVIELIDGGKMIEMGDEEGDVDDMGESEGGRKEDGFEVLEG